MQWKKSANWKSSTQKKSSGHDQTMTSELAVAIVCLNAELKKGQFLNLFSVDKSNLRTVATYEERELHWCCFTHHLLAGRSNKNCKQLTEFASGKWHIHGLELSMAQHPTHTTREITPCENELEGHLQQVTETLSTASSEGTKTVLLKKSRCWFRANQVVSGPSRAATNTSTLVQ